MRVPLVSEILQQILCKITANRTKDGVMKSVTFEDVHCVRRTTLPRNGSVRRDRDDVSVWEHKGLLLVNSRRRFEHCVDKKSIVAQFIFENWTKPITVNQTQDGVEKRERETFVDEHTVTREDFVSRKAKKKSASQCLQIKTLRTAWRTIRWSVPAGGTT